MSSSSIWNWRDGVLSRLPESVKNSKNKLLGPTNKTRTNRFLHRELGVIRQISLLYSLSLQRNNSSNRDNLINVVGESSGRYSRLIGANDAPHRRRIHVDEAEDYLLESTSSSSVTTWPWAASEIRTGAVSPLNVSSTAHFGHNDSAYRPTLCCEPLQEVEARLRRL
ncbi:hypothetical protein M758_8G031000 [Ceratodon purpureus]|nr:hypothetical protein M758_8G031000 [Ceratodon purpureus]